MLEAGTVLRNKYGKLVSLGVDSDHLEKNWNEIMQLGKKEPYHRYPTFPNTVRIRLEYEQATLEFRAFIPGESPLVTYLLNSNDFLHNPNISLVNTKVPWSEDNNFRAFDIMIYDKKFKLYSICGS